MSKQTSLKPLKHLKVDRMIRGTRTCHALTGKGKQCKNSTWLIYKGMPLCGMHRGIAEEKGMEISNG